MLTKVIGGDVRGVSKKLAKLGEITQAVKAKETKLIQSKTEIKSGLSYNRHELLKNVIIDPVIGAIKAVKETVQACSDIIVAQKVKINDLKFQKSSVTNEITDLKTGEAEIKRLGHTIEVAEGKRAKLVEKRVIINSEIRAENVLGTVAEKKIKEIADGILKAPKQ